MWNPAFQLVTEVSIVLRTLTFFILITFALNAEISLAQTIYMGEKVSNEIFPYSIFKAKNGFMEVKGNSTLTEADDGSYKVEKNSKFALCFTPKYFQEEEEATHSMKYHYDMTSNDTNCYSVDFEGSKDTINYHNEIVSTSKKSFLHLCKAFKPSCGMLDRIFMDLARLKSTTANQIINTKMVVIFPELMPLAEECTSKHFHSRLFDHFCGYDEPTHGNWTVQVFLEKVWGIQIQTDSQSSSRKDHCYQSSSELHCSIAGCGVDKDDTCGTNDRILYLKSNSSKSVGKKSDTAN